MHLTNLNLQLLDTDDPAKRKGILDAIYVAEQQLSGDRPEGVPVPLALDKLQRDLRPSDLFIEYVLDDPASYALAVTESDVHCYELPAKSQLEEQATEYRSEVIKKKADFALAQKLFDELLGHVPDYKEKTNIIVVPDGELHLLPFSALADSGQYVLTSHVVTVAPSGTVLDMLRHRANQPTHDDRPYVGVAAWITPMPTQTTTACPAHSFTPSSHRNRPGIPWRFQNRMPRALCN